MALESVGLASLFTASGGAVGAYGSLKKGAGEKAAADYNVAVATRNASIARGQAAVDAADKERENRKSLASFRAAFGAGGLSFAESGLDAFEDQATEAELAVRRIRYSGELRAMGYTEQADLSRMAGRAASTAGMIGAASHVVSAAASMYRIKAGARPGAGAYAD